jgi:hypothetical protein
MGSLTFVSADTPAFTAGVRVGGQALLVNDLIADLEADIATPAAVIAEVHAAYEALNRASLFLFDRAIGIAKAKGHYTDLAAQAMDGAA